MISNLRDSTWECQRVPLSNKNVFYERTNMTNLLAGFLSVLHTHLRRQECFNPTDKKCPLKTHPPSVRRNLEPAKLAEWFWLTIWCRSLDDQRPCGRKKLAFTLRIRRECLMEACAQNISVKRWPLEYCSTVTGRIFTIIRLPEDILRM